MLNDEQRLASFITHHSSFSSPMSRPLRRPPYLLLLPFFGALAAFWLVPLARGLVLSLESNALFGEASFVGLANYRALLSDTRYAHALRNTVAYCGMVLLAVLPFSLLLAHLLRRAHARLRTPLQFCLLLPGLTPPLVLSVLYLLVFHGPGGLLNLVLLHPFGLPDLDWIRDPRLIKVSLVLLMLWRWTGFMTLIFLSGLEGVPRAYHDAARIEGASAWQRFRRVTLPMLRPVTAFAAAFLLLDAFVLFEGAYVLLGGSGGTLDAGLLLVSYSYNTGFSLGNFGAAAAMSFAALPPLLIALVAILATGRPAGSRRKRSATEAA
jgi:ABC-type sugar transport system permease subunit